MSALLRFPHGLMRRYLSLLERLLVSAGLVGLLYGLMSNLPVYPANWDLVILATVFVVALWSPAAAYFIAAAAALYPLYSLSLYMAVLFLAVAVLGQRIFIHNLGPLVLVLAAPWLAQYNLAWIIPILGGLWWGAAGGAWMGALGALWGQLAAGMAGLNPDWLALTGTAPTVAGVAQRFGQADSLQTLKLILEPFAPTSTVLLYHLLQVAAWSVVGGVVGILADRPWIRQHRPVGTLVAGFLGALALLGAHVGLSLWLEQYTTEAITAMGPALLIMTATVMGVVGVLEGVRGSLENPLPPPPRRRRARPAARPTDKEFEEPERVPLPVPTQLPAWEPTDEAEDLIQIELD
jgi:hypothetical protein